MDKKYIQIYDNVLSEDLCSRLINNFESHGVDRHEFFDDEFKKFNQLTLDQTDYNQGRLIVEVLDTMIKQYYTYIKDCGISQYQVPNSHSIGYEGLRIKKYYDSTCCFDPHVDVIDLESSKRFISFLFYLNDVESGGETIFFDNSPLIINPKMGRVVMFPPLWTYPHQGSPVLSGTKYILSSYLNFVK